MCLLLLCVERCVYYYYVMSGECEDKRSYMYGSIVTLSHTQQVQKIAVLFAGNHVPEIISNSPVRPSFMVWIRGQVGPAILHSWGFSRVEKVNKKGSKLLLLLRSKFSLYIMLGST